MGFEPLRIYGKNRYAEEYISFEIEPEDLLNNYERYERYVKHIEAIVRGDDRYTSYIAKLKQGGLTKCAVMGNLPTDDPKIKVEMHHGPIFNLFDYCDIVLKASLQRGKKNLTSFDIADLILTEHEKDNIMIVMLSKSVHMEGAHNKKSNKGIFIGIEATFGRIDRFIDRWSDGMEKEHCQYIDRYIAECKKANGKTMDQGLFDVAEQLESFK
ncbi:MAG: hypothetical protein NC489_09050 [Ruminococcus flavefaciens]|nr:hypothetical protein [Ruminococcus flavefaciens]